MKYVRKIFRIFDPPPPCMDDPLSNFFLLKKISFGAADRLRNARQNNGYT